MALPSIGKIPPSDTQEVINDAEKLADDGKAAVKEEVAKAEEAMIQFSSHPMQRFAFGQWKFTNGLLTLPAEEAAKFEEQWNSQPPALRRMVQKINVDNAEAVLKKLVDSNRAASGSIQAGITTTASELPLIHPEEPGSADAGIVK